MRVLVVTHAFPVVSETFVTNHVASLRRRGIDACVLASRGDLDLLKNAEMQQDVPQWRFEVQPLQGSSAAQALRGLSRLPLDGRRLKLAWRLVGEAARGRRSGKTSAAPAYAHAVRNATPFDVVHAHHGHAALMACYLRDAGYIEAPVIATFHGSDLNLKRRCPPEKLYARVFQQAAICTTGTEFMAAPLIKGGVPDDRRRVVPMGVDVSLFAPTSAPLKPRVPMVSVGRLIDWKGTRFAIEAVAILKDRGFDTELSVVGDGPMRGELDTLVERLGVADRVNLLGPLPAPKTREVVRASSIFVHPGIVNSQGCCEGQGVVLAEAQASGKPVVASRVGGIPEAVREGETALLTPPGDATAMADAIQKLLEAPELASRMGAAGRKLVEESFDHERLIDTWVDAYGHVIAREKASRN